MPSTAELPALSEQKLYEMSKASEETKEIILDPRPVVMIYKAFNEPCRPLRQKTEIFCFYNQQTYAGTIDQIAAKLRSEKISITEINNSVPNHENHANYRLLSQGELDCLTKRLSGYTNSSQIIPSLDDKIE